MTSNQSRNRALEGLECLNRAIRKELQRKALLGQHAIIYRDGKACRVPAEEALKIAEDKKGTRY